MDPIRVRDLGRLGDDDRLLAMMMIRDEDDVLADTLACAARWFDRIYVLDGTTDPERVARTDAILAACPEVRWHARDADWFPDGVTDGARQVLLERIRRDHGVDNWIGVLHADEFLDQDPRPMLAARHPSLHPSVRVRVAHAFLHVDDRADWDPDLPLRERVGHVMWPGVPEARFFFDDGSRDFDVDHHSKVIPRSHRPGELVDGYVIVQYNERDPDQLVARARARAASGWQVGHYARLLDEPPDVWVDTLDRSEAPFAPEFAGDPEGPFRPVPIDDVPVVFRRDDAPARIVAARATGATAARDTAGRAAVDRVGRARVDLGFVTGADGLLRLVERPDRRAVGRWTRLVRAEALAPPGTAALLRHTATVLAGGRATRAHRERVAAEFVTAYAGAVAGGSWETVLPDADAVRLGALLGVDVVTDG